MKQPSAGGGWPAIRYALARARAGGGLWRMYRALRSRNACKTCALGMGGQRGGMVNEAGRFPEVCKKSIQAMAADMQGAIRPHFFDDFNLEALRGFTPRELEAAGRITRPMVAGPLDTTYRPIAWDDALDRIARTMKATDPEEAFLYFSGRSSNEAAFLLQLFARAWGTNHVSNCSYYCHQASGVGLASVTGSGTATVVLEDLEHCDLLVLAGANPASNHPRFMRSLIDLKRRGGRIVVINPLRERGLERFKVPSDVRSLLFGSTIADLYVQPHVGGDIALCAAVGKAILERGAENRGFLDAATEGADAVIDAWRRADWDDLVAASGVARATIERVADLYASSRSAIFAWAMGLTHHRHGVQNVQALANLALVRGMTGRRGAGLLPLRGHSNVQGIGSVGVTPALRAAVAEGIVREFGITLPEHEGHDTLAAMEAAVEGKVRIAWCLGGNLYGASPDLAFAARAFASIDTVVHLSTTLNTGHAHGRGRETYILPVQARDEEAQATTQESMFNYVRLSDGGAPRHEGPRSEVEIVVDIARRVLGDAGGIDWTALRDHRAIRAAIGRVIPGYGAVGDIDATRREFQIEGRTFHQARFATPSGRAAMHVVELPELPPQDGHLRLMTVRSEGQFNTVVYEEHDLYRGQDRRDVILMHPDDIARFGLEVDGRCRVTSSTGVLRHVTVRAFDIRAGNAAMYYPEANVLISRDVDPQSRTPAYKCVAITVERETEPSRDVESDREDVPTGAVPRRDLKRC